MSPKSMGKLLEEIGVDHDGKLKEWKNNIHEYFSNIITHQKALETLKSQRAARTSDIERWAIQIEILIS